MKQLNKSKWAVHKFENFVENVREQTMPIPEDSKNYIGLEHLNSESIHVRKWGTEIRLKGTKFKMKKGDLLFARRNAYLRRVAIAPHDGLFSAHGMIFRPKKDVVLPNFLPFFLSSDAFMDRAIKISVGSLSPTINWGTLRHEEFSLPPLDQQGSIADLLWSVDNVEEHWEKVKQLNETTGKSLLRRALRIGLENEKMVKRGIYSPFQTKIVKEDVPVSWNMFQIRDIVESVQTGFAEGGRDDNGIQQLRMQNVGRDCSLVWDDVIRVPKREGYEKYLLKNRDVLFNNTNSEDLVGKSILFLNNEEPMVFSNHFTRIRVKPDLILPEYLYLWLRYHFEIGLFERRCTRWIGQAAVQTENLLSLYVLLPPIEDQKNIVTRISSHDQLAIDIKRHIDETKKIKKTILNQIFG